MEVVGDIDSIALVRSQLIITQPSHVRFHLDSNLEICNLPDEYLLSSNCYLGYLTYSSDKIMILSQQNKNQYLLFIAFSFVTLSILLNLGQSYLHFQRVDKPFPLLSMLISVAGSSYILLLFVPLIARIKNRLPLATRPIYLLPLLMFIAVMSSIHIVLAGIFNLLYLGNSLSFLDRVSFGFQQDFLLLFVAYLTIFAFAYGLDYFLRFRQRDEQVQILQGQQVHAETKHKEILTVKDGSQLKNIPFTEIQYLEAFDNYIKIHTELKTFLTRGTLKSMEKALTSSQFIRIHRSFIVNKEQVQSADRLQNGDVNLHLQSGQVLRMSRTYRQKLALLFPA